MEGHRSTPHYPRAQWYKAPENTCSVAGGVRLVSPSHWAPDSAAQVPPSPTSGTSLTGVGLAGASHVQSPVLQGTQEISPSAPEASAPLAPKPPNSSLTAPRIKSRRPQRHRPGLANWFLSYFLISILPIVASSIRDRPESHLHDGHRFLVAHWHCQPP